MEHRSGTVFTLTDVNIFFGTTPILTRANVSIRDLGITTVIGSSGSGKSTLLRTLNRLNDHYQNFRCTGTVLYKGKNIYAEENGDLEVSRLRKNVGMVFQKPCLFPTSIYENVLFGLRRLSLRQRSEFPETVEAVLKAVSLWDEVKDRLKHPATELSQGQQQRLSLARALACDPRVLMLDEPTASLDPQSSETIEMLLQELSARMTIILVTHNLAQVQRLSTEVVFLCDGCVCKYGSVADLFRSPTEAKIQHYLAGHTV